MAQPYTSTTTNAPTIITTHEHREFRDSGPVTVQYPDHLNDKRYRCCCNSMHVERGAYVIAFIGALLAAIFGILNLLSGNIILFIFSIFIFLVYWFIIAAQRKRHPGLYLPFLVINGLVAILLALYIIFLVLMLIVLPDFWVRQHDSYGVFGPSSTVNDASGRFWPAGTANDAHRDHLVTDEHGQKRYFWGAIRLFTWLQLIYSIVAELLTIYFWYVVYRAWQFMRAERRHPGTHHHGSAFKA